jgi:PEGA domain-containing protein
VRLRVASLWVPLAMLCASSAPLAAQVRVMYPPMPYAYPYRFAGPESNVRLQITPRQAAVYVDGYFAGQVDQYDGIFQRLHVTPGQHELVIYLAGYRSLHEQLYLGPNATRKISGKMEPLRAGEPNDPVPAPVNPPADEGQIAPQGQMPPPRPGVRRGPPFPPLPPDNGGSSSTVGTVAIRVQPAGAEILIDGGRWNGPARADERLVVQLSEGRHVLTIHRPGYRDFSIDVDVRRGETTPINVSLTPDR